MFNQLTMTWTHLDVWLRRDMPEPISDMTITQFPDQLGNTYGERPMASPGLSLRGGYVYTFALLMIILLQTSGME